ncbi:GNAT family N-acetyltransferase [Streptomyces sp. WZ-12]|uniref:GNAT family N-acetyltransferase n=1 Tax=Streptomyces sp. WZ-12 TaxID=3030210 RepID=UPI002380C673|nr:GNAT family N-acetyltransferase [Streptomyces sp. WZ-12]
MTPRLTAPTVRVHDSFRAAMAEFRAEGVHRSPDSGLGRELRTWHTRWPSAEGFAAYVREVGGVALDERADGAVPLSTLWWVDGDTFLGRITVRHRLTPSLRDLGGHIGYAVRPTARRRGHATAMLRAVLPYAHRELGLDPVLVTCDDTNAGSRRVIEACGGVFEDRRAERLRYWISA